MDIIPTRDGHTFTGWYESKSDGEAVDLTKSIVDGTRLYAHWVTKHEQQHGQLLHLQHCSGELRYRRRCSDNHDTAKLLRRAIRWPTGGFRPLAYPAVSNRSPVPGKGWLCPKSCANVVRSVVGEMTSVG